MNKFRLTVKLLAIATFMFAFSSLAQAQATRTWVSGVGDDANPCSRTAPCKTFAGAISKTAPCGEIDALDPGGFGAVTITKAITIDGTAAGIAGVLVSGTNGIVISANASTDVITLRGLDINGICSGLNGIQILSAKGVNVYDCVIYKFTQNGINVAVGADMALAVRNTVIHDNTGDGIRTATTAGQVRATLDNVSSTVNGSGVHATQSSRIDANNCNFSNNTGNGVFADATGAFATIRVWNSMISMNAGGGVRAGNAGGGVSGAEIGQDQINHNIGAGVILGTGGVVETFSNNSIRGNIGGDGCAGCSTVGPGN